MKPQTLADVHPMGLYEVDDVARVLDLSPDYVYLLGKTPKLPATRLGLRGGRVKWLGSVILKHAQPAVAA